MPTFTNDATTALTDAITNNATTIKDGITGVSNTVINNTITPILSANIQTSLNTLFNLTQNQLNHTLSLNNNSPVDSAALITSLIVGQIANLDYPNVVANAINAFPTAANAIVTAAILSVSGDYTNDIKTMLNNQSLDATISVAAARVTAAAAARSIANNTVNYGTLLKKWPSVLSSNANDIFASAAAFLNTPDGINIITTVIGKIFNSTTVIDAGKFAAAATIVNPSHVFAIVLFTTTNCPTSAVDIVTAIIDVAPLSAATAVTAAITAVPNSVVAIITAALAAAPLSAVAIVNAALAVAPLSADTINATYTNASPFIFAAAAVTSAIKTIDSIEAVAVTIVHDVIAATPGAPIAGIILAAINALPSAGVALTMPTVYDASTIKITTNVNDTPAVIVAKLAIASIINDVVSLSPTSNYITNITNLFIAPIDKTCIITVLTTSNIPALLNRMIYTAALTDTITTNATAIKDGITGVSNTVINNTIIPILSANIQTSLNTLFNLTQNQLNHTLSLNNNNPVDSAALIISLINSITVNSDTPAMVAAAIKAYPTVGYAIVRAAIDTVPSSAKVDAIIAASGLECDITAASITVTTMLLSDANATLMRVIHGIGQINVNNLLSAVVNYVAAAASYANKVNNCIVYAITAAPSSTVAIVVAAITTTPSLAVTIVIAAINAVTTINAVTSAVDIVATAITVAPHSSVAIVNAALATAPLSAAAIYSVYTNSIFAAAAVTSAIKTIDSIEAVAVTIVHDAIAATPGAPIAGIILAAINALPSAGVALTMPTVYDASTIKITTNVNDTPSVIVAKLAIASIINDVVSLSPTSNYITNITNLFIAPIDKTCIITGLTTNNYDIPARLKDLQY